MFQLALVIAAVIFATITTAAPLASFQAFQITNMTVQKTLGGNVTLHFNIYDPDPLTNAKQVCTGSWKTGSKRWPTGGYQPCGSSTFAWIVDSWDSVGSFVLDVEHIFEDPSIGDPPYDYITNYGRAKVNKSNSGCTTRGKRTTCKQKDGSVIMAPIYASSS